jgi:hypothetical protein
MVRQAVVKRLRGCDGVMLVGLADTAPVCPVDVVLLSLVDGTLVDAFLVLVLAGAILVCAILALADAAPAALVEETRACDRATC